MSATPLSAKTGACVLRTNAVTSTTTASAGRPARAAAGLGLTSTTTASLNVSADQSNSVSPSELSSSPAVNGSAFFCTSGTVSFGPPVPGAQIVKCDRTSSVPPPPESVPRITYRPSALGANAQVAACPEASGSAVTEPSGRVTFMFVQSADRLAVSVIVETARTVEPSFGEEETNTGVACAVTGTPVSAGGTIGVWFATAATNEAVAFPAASCSAFMAGTA